MCSQTLSGYLFGFANDIVNNCVVSCKIGVSQFYLSVYKLATAIIIFESKKINDHFSLKSSGRHPNSITFSKRNWLKLINKYLLFAKFVLCRIHDGCYISMYTIKKILILRIRCIQTRYLLFFYSSEPWSLNTWYYWRDSQKLEMASGIPETW